MQDQPTKAFNVYKDDDRSTEIVWEKYVPNDYSDVPSLIWHRVGGAAYKYKDNKFISIIYYQNDQYHRYDGPASIDIDRFPKKHTTHTSWYIRGQRVDEYHYRLWLIEMGMDINNLSDNDKVLIDLKWGGDDS